MTSLRRSFSCNTGVTNVEVQDTYFLDTPIYRIATASIRYYATYRIKPAAADLVMVLNLSAVSCSWNCRRLFYDVCVAVVIFEHVLYSVSSLLPIACVVCYQTFCLCVVFVLDLLCSRLEPTSTTTSSTSLSALDVVEINK